jgi:hypothetical protein
MSLRHGVPRSAYAAMLGTAAGSIQFLRPLISQHFHIAPAGAQEIFPLAAVFVLWPYVICLRLISIGVSWLWAIPYFLVECVTQNRHYVKC